MDADELRKTLKRLDAMRERCDYVISRNRPLTLDEPPRSRGKVVVPHSAKLRQHTTMPRPLEGGVATGQLAGNEMRLSNGYSARTWKSSDSCDPDGMWANFESEFDDMVAGMH